MSLPVAKNAMRRAIEALYYRPLNQNEKDRIWKYFKSRCAYCNKPIDRAHRHGHMDHLDSSAIGGGNYIRNRVLACKECNGNEKREYNWKKFLKSKCHNPEVFIRRKSGILAWQKQFPPLVPIELSPEGELAKSRLLGAINDFEQRFIRFRSVIRKCLQ